MRSSKTKERPATQSNVAADCKRFARLIASTRRVSKGLTPATIAFILADRHVRYGDNWPHTIPGAAFHAGRLPIWVQAM